MLTNVERYVVARHIADPHMLWERLAGSVIVVRPSSLGSFARI